MWLKICVVFLAFTFSGSIFMAILFWVLDGLPTKTVRFFSFFSIQFETVWKFLLVSTVFASPMIFILNFWSLFWYTCGYKWLGDSAKIWPVQIALLGTGPLIFILMTYFWRGELPGKGSVVAFALCAAGIVVSKIWR